MWAWVPRPIAGERAVCAARGSVVGGRSALVASPGAQAPSGILGMMIRSRSASGEAGGQSREKVGCTEVGDTCGAGLTVCPFHFQDWKWQTI